MVKLVDTPALGAGTARYESSSLSSPTKKFFVNFIRNFRDITKHDVALAGGKGASLGEMTRAGIPIPPGFVVLSIAYDRFLEEAHLIAEIDSQLHGVDLENVHTVESASETIQALIMQASMSKDLGAEILEALEILDVEFVAVRSSATAEDSASGAWAGQLDSYLNTPKVQVIENVKRCFASLFTPRAIFYRHEQGLHDHHISVAVVVQNMVESEKSGVAFSVHPVTEDRNQLIIEAGFGLGEAIVSGQITPDSYVIEKEPRRVIEVDVHTQTRGLYRATAGGNAWRELSLSEGEARVLSDAEGLELSEIVVNIERHYGFPCDIEWAFAGEHFYIVQSRPITTLTTN